MTDTKASPAHDAGAKTAPMRKLPPHKQENWTGYTLDEIRYQRAYTLARIEINTSRLKQNAETFVDGGPGSSRSVVGRILSTFSYVDLALLVWKVGAKVFQTRRLFKH